MPHEPGPPHDGLHTGPDAAQPAPCPGWVPVDLASWQRAVHAAATIPRREKLTLLRVALDSEAGTGTKVVINVARVCDELAISRATLWRHLRPHIGTWLVQTDRPTTGGPDRGGRRARYRLMAPAESSLTAPRARATRPRKGPTGGPLEPGVVSHPGRDTTAVDNLAPEVGEDPGSCLTLGETRQGRVVSQNGPSRVSKRAESCLTTQRDRETDPSSVGTSSVGTSAASSAAATREDAAAAVDNPSGERAPTAGRVELPGELEILRSRLDARRLHVRWDRLDDAQLAEIVELVHRHGDAALVKAALVAYRPEDPPVFAQAWISAWRELPDPGQQLRLVRERCPIRDHHHDGEGPCRGCLGDRKATGGRGS